MLVYGACLIFRRTTSPPSGMSHAGIPKGPHAMDAPPTRTKYEGVRVLVRKTKPPDRDARARSIITGPVIGPARDELIVAPEPPGGRPGRIGTDGSWSYPWLPRPASWPAADQLPAMCNATGINEDLFLLSLRHPGAIRCASHELATVALRNPPPCAH